MWKYWSDRWQEIRRFEHPEFVTLHTQCLYHIVVDILLKFITELNVYCTINQRGDSCDQVWDDAKVFIEEDRKQSKDPLLIDFDLDALKLFVNIICSYIAISCRQSCYI